MKTQKKIFGKEYHAAWRKRNRDRNAESHRRFYHKRKSEVLTHYGGSPPRCGCCGESEYMFLTIDHINGDGREHRRIIKKKSIYDWLKSNGYPNGFQVLCFNCNCGKSINKGICPHKRLTPN